MMLPKITAMCPTYGRTSLLEESIESFFRQDYAGPKELIVVNDLPEQELCFYHPDVQVFNLKKRCIDLAHKRNTVAEMASGELIITWSDDDIHLPQRMRFNFESYIENGYVFESKHIFFNGKEQVLKNQGLAGPFLMSKKDFFALGGIPPAQTGEDQLFMAKVRNANMKIRSSSGIGYVYRWNCTARYHVSWFDKKIDAWERCKASVHQSMNDGKEPIGKIELKPHWKQDYSAIAAKLLQ